ncbi:MAG: ATP-binding protein [Actinobacteria bacterium]|nr:ATP-binding protein [Actinomycetota bacterium]
MSVGSAGSMTSGIGRRFARQTQQLTAIRRFVRTWFEARSVDASAIDDLELAVSELATNAIQHGSGDVIEIQLADEPDELVAVVAADTEHLERIGTVSSWHIAPPDAVNGRGLGIVAAVMDSIEFSSDDGRAVFRCRRRR